MDIKTLFGDKIPLPAGILGVCLTLALIDYINFGYRFSPGKIVLFWALVTVGWGIATRLTFVLNRCISPSTALLGCFTLVGVGLTINALFSALF